MEASNSASCCATEIGKGGPRVLEAPRMPSARLGKPWGPVAHFLYTKPATTFNRYDFRYFANAHMHWHIITPRLLHYYLIITPLQPHYNPIMTPLLRYYCRIIDPSLSYYYPRRGTYIHTYTYIYIHIYIHTYIYTYIYTNIHI